MTLRDLYYNYTGYPNVYKGGGLGNFFRGMGNWVKHPFDKTARYNASVQSNPNSYGSGEITNFNTTGNGTTDWGSMGGFATGQTSQNNITNPYQGTTMMEQGFAQTGTPTAETVDGNAFADISKSGKSEGTFTRGGGGVPWGAIIGAAGTNIANAFLDTEASTADRVAGALGIPALANQWRADTSKGDAYIKDMQNSMDLNSKNYIQDASSSWGGANAVKQNLKTNISPISFNSAVPSLKDFKGNWWRNMGASVAQGAASGSVGGPWGALGGAVTGLFGSIGGLFGRKGRAERAYKDFLAKRNTLVSAQEAAYNRAVTDQTLSNMQALANGNTQQRINDMANIRAFGGNLFTNGGGLIDPDPPFDDWYKTVPSDRNDTTSYNLRRAYELAPKEDLENWRTATPDELISGEKHLNSVYYNEGTGEYEFMKSKNHPTLKYELDWYYGDTPEATDFRKKYNLDKSGEYYKYIPNNTEYAMGGNLYPIGGTIREGDEEVTQEPVYEGGELPEITVSAEPMPWYEKAWRKFDRNVLKYPKYAYNYFFPDKNKFIVLDDNTEINRVTDESSAFGNDYILSNEFVEKKNPNTIRTARDFQYPNQDTLLGDNNIPLDNISTYYGIENGKLKAGKASDFEDDTFIVPNRTKNVGKIREIQLPIEGEYDWGMPWSDERAEQLRLHNEFMELNESFVNQKKYAEELRSLFDKYYGMNNSTAKRAAALARQELKKNHKSEYDDYMADWNTRNKELLKKVTITEPKEGYVITENNDTLPIPNFNATPKMYFADENGNAAFVSGLKPNIEKVNDYLSEHPSYPIMVDNGRFKHIIEGDDINAYTGGFMNPEDNYIIGIKQKAMGGNLYTDLSPNMMNLWNNKQQIDQQKVNMQQMNFGLGNSFNQKLNTFDYGGSMNGMDLPTGMQSYENGGTHEENPYGGIQVGVDQQGNPNLVEEGEFRWGDYIFSDRINVDPTLLSRYNLAPATKHQGKKANKGKLSYADMAKKYAKKNGELANDPIGKNTLEAYMKRLQDAQEDQKFQDSMEQQKQDAINQYRNALTTPQQGNPMYGAMKYNGMGNAATQQGVNAGMSDLGQQGGGNEVLSNTNRSGNNMLHAFGGNLFWRGGRTLNPPPYGDPESRIDYAMSYIGNPVIPNGNSRIDYANQFLQGNPPANDYGVSDFMNRIYSGNVGYGSPKVNTTVAQTQTQTPQNFQEWALWQHDNGNKPYVGSANTGVEPDAFALQAQGRTANGSTTNADYTTGYNGTANTDTGRSNLTGNINTGNTTTGTYTTNAFKEDREGIPLYSTAGKFATFGKGLTPMLYDWMNKTNTKYDPKQRPANELVNMGNNSTFLRTADTIGGYRAPNLMDAERMNNAAQAQGLAALQTALSTGNGNRGFAAAQANQQMYNTGMGIGNNYATAQQANNEERYKTDAYNTAIDQFNANARNTSYQDNQRAEQVGQQMALSAKQAANDYLQKENWYADRTNRTAMDNRATNQAAWTDNALNYFITQAQENAERNRQNNDITKRYWSDKDGVMHYIGDSGLNGKIREYFRKNKIDNGTFTGDRLAAFNSIIQNNKAKDVANEKGELWSTVQGLMDDEIAARNKEIADADKAKADELQEYRDQFDSELAQLQRYGSDKMYGDYWRNQADLDYYSGATGKFKRDEQSLSQLRDAIDRLKGYNKRYNKWTPQNVTAYGGRINNGNKNNKNGYYTYTY